MTVIQKLQFPEAKFDLYFLGYDSPKSHSYKNSTADREGLIELTHNYGTEDDASYKVNTGNEEPHRGFGHTCISVDNIQAACKRLEDAGYSFKKKLTDGRMKHIAFALDPDGYWVEIIGQKSLEASEKETETDTTTYHMVRFLKGEVFRPDQLTRIQNHTMLRVKDIEKSLTFYQDVLGMSLFRTSKSEAAGFNLYFLGYPGKLGVPSSEAGTANREGILELTWNYGTEKDEKFKYHNGNDQPQGFGHICRSNPKIFNFGSELGANGECVGVSVDHLDAACQRFEDLGCNWKKRLTDGRMKNVAFLLDPDGYWIEVIQNEKFTGKPNF
jgi:lactoylglutathione lyase